MDAKLLSRLRPADDTAEALSAALDRISSECRAADAQLVDLHEARGRMLLTGTPKQVTETEATSRETEILIDQLELLAGQLRPKLAAARAAERRAAFEGQATAARAVAESAVAWFRDVYPRLGREIVDGLQLCRAAENEWNDLQHRYGVACSRDADLSALRDPVGTYPPMPRTTVGGLDVPPSQAVQLPAAAGELEPIWWPRLLRGRPRPIGD